MSKLLIPAAAVVALALNMPAHADQYDGKWLVAFPTSVSDQKEQGIHSCPGFRIGISIANDQITAELKQSNQAAPVTNSSVQAGEPVTGTVNADGTYTAHWRGFVVTGKLMGDTGDAHVVSECGPRTGTVARE